MLKTKTLLLLGAGAAVPGAVLLSSALTAGSSTTAPEGHFAVIADKQAELECPTTIAQHAMFETNAYSAGEPRISSLASHTVTMLENLGASSETTELVSDDLAIIQVTDGEHVVGVFVAERDSLGWHLNSQDSCGDQW